MSELVEALTDTERADLVKKVDADGYAIVPRKLTPAQIATLIQAIDRVTNEIRGDDKSRSVKVANIVDKDPAFKNLMMFEPALQLAYDFFGPTFNLCQSNFISRPKEKAAVADFVSASPWHADGPRPFLFPKINGATGMHYLKFGYFLTNLTHGNGGPLQVVRGSHLKPELDGIPHSTFDIKQFEKDLVTFNVEEGTIVAFHQAQWHAAPPNYSEIERKNIYISYCPNFMRPFDRAPPTEESVRGESEETKWLLGAPRPPARWWLPSTEDLTVLDKYKRVADQGRATKTVYYD